MKVLLKKALNFFGYKLQRQSPDGKILKSPHTQNRIIELMGPSGVGKTTLSSDAVKLFQYKWNTSFPKSAGLRSDHGSTLDDLYRYCLSKNINQLQDREKDFSRFAFMLSFKTKLAMEDRHLKQSGLLNDGGWLLDDGFCHNFDRQIVDIIEEKKIDEDQLRTFFGGRNFVLTEADDSWIVKNLQNRQKMKPGAANDWLSIYGESELLKLIRKNFKLKRKLVRLAENYGAFSFEIDFTKGYENAVHSLVEIESEVIKRNEV